MPPKTLSIVVDRRPSDLSPTVFFNPLFSSTLPSTFVTFMDINTSSPVLGFFQSPCYPCVRVCPAVGYALLLPAVGCALLQAVGPLFSTRCGSALLPAVGPLFWLLVIRIIHLFVFTQSADFRFRAVLAPRRCCLRVRQSRPASAVHTPSSQCGALVCQRLAFSCGRHGTP